MGQPGSSTSNKALKWTAGILATIISGVAVFWLTEGLSSRTSTSESDQLEASEQQPKEQPEQDLLTQPEQNSPVNGQPPSELSESRESITSDRFRLDKASFTPGSTIKLHFTAEENFESNAWIGIVPSGVSHGSEEVNDRHDQAYEYLQNRISGTSEFTAPTEPGSYDFRMNNDGAEVDFITFEVAPPTLESLTNNRLRLDKTSFTPGSTIEVHFQAEDSYDSNAWIGIVPSGVSHGSENVNDRNDIAYKYLQNRVSGTLKFTAPTEPGPYDFRMNNDAAEVSFISFEVTEF